MKVTRRTRTKSVQVVADATGVVSHAGRRATVEEIANVYAILASDEASFVTGVVWVVDGGVGISRGLPGEKADGDPPPSELPTRHRASRASPIPQEESPGRADRRAGGRRLG